MCKVLVLGSTGLIGHQVYFYLKSVGRYELFNFAYRTPLDDDTLILDARCEEVFVENIKKINPDVIVNCIGILIDGANKDPENAIYLNAYLPHRLARVATDINAKLIHISTDCVFSGKKGTSYVETDPTDGTGFYSKSKALGEILVDKHLTLRTSVVGPELKTNGEELFHWFMTQTGDISGYTQAIWSGVTTIELARAVDFAIKNDVSGLYHVTNNVSISKYELLVLFQRHMNRDVNILPVDGNCSNKSFVDMRLVLNYQIPSYDSMIATMAARIFEDNVLYSQYQT